MDNNFLHAVSNIRKAIEIIDAEKTDLITLNDNTE